MAESTDTANAAHDEVPAAIHRLVSLPQFYRAECSPYGSWSIYWRSLELRFAHEGGDVWCFDEVVGKCWIHIEQMDDSYYWMALHPLDETGAEYEDHDRLCVNIGSRTSRASVVMTGWAD